MNTKILTLLCSDDLECNELGVTILLKSSENEIKEYIKVLNQEQRNWLFGYKKKYGIYRTKRNGKIK